MGSGAGTGGLFDRCAGGFTCAGRLPLNVPMSKAFRLWRRIGNPIFMRARYLGCKGVEDK